MLNAAGPIGSPPLALPAQFFRGFPDLRFETVGFHVIIEG
jgi:hypothetical protein